VAMNMTIEGYQPEIGLRRISRQGNEALLSWKGALIPNTGPAPERRTVPFISCQLSTVFLAVEDGLRQKEQDSDRSQKPQSCAD
jgi:hypothetical protein